MKKLKIILIGVLLYSLMGVVLVNSIETTLIPKFRPFGKSTAFADSTNYITLSGKGLYVYDSVRVGKDLYVGTSGGSIYLDTNKQGQLYYTGLSQYIANLKAKGYMYFGTSEQFVFVPVVTGSLGNSILTIDTNTLIIDPSKSFGNIELKLAGDTASDYDGDDAITLNRQSGRLTTKSLTTGANTNYSLSWLNNLVTATSKVFGTVGDLTSAGSPIVLRCVSGSGIATIDIRNVDDAVAFNNTITVNVLVINSP